MNSLEQLPEVNLHESSNGAHASSGRYEAATGECAVRAPEVAFSNAIPATFAFQLGRRANFFPRASFTSL